jgi:hypothetical protein
MLLKKLEKQCLEIFIIERLLSLELKPEIL